MRELTEADVLASKEADMEAIEAKTSGRKRRKSVSGAPTPTASSETIAKAAVASAAKVDRALANVA